MKTYPRGRFIKLYLGPPEEVPGGMVDATDLKFVRLTPVLVQVQWHVSGRSVKGNTSALGADNVSSSLAAPNPGVE